MALVYDVEGGPIQIKTIEQSEQTDCNFYMDLCSTYGLAMTIVGNAMWVASQCVAVKGLEKLSGKYYLDQITHHIGGGYTMDLEMSLVE